MAEIVSELGVKSPKKQHQTIRSRNNNVPVNFVKRNKKENEKQIVNKACHLEDLSQTNISLQKSKRNYQGEEKHKSEQAGDCRVISTNRSSRTTKGSPEKRKDHVKNNEIINGFDKMHHNSKQKEYIENSKESDKKIRSKKGKSDLNTKMEPGNVSDVEK